ncbi:MAG: ABC transporter ATP-binding protein [Bacteroidales bacterium]|nr:ABC transporter ATP-binding protein [Bacteroidales bacterium]
MIVRELYKAYRKNQVLKGINLEFEPGRITAVLGPNGSGKTTLIKCLLGMVIAQKGEIVSDGSVIGSNWHYRRNIGYLPQIARFPENLKVSELITMVKDIRGQQADHGELAAILGLEPFMNKPLRYLSGGTRQKVNILIAFMFDNRYYILDEPTAGLDPLAMIHFKELLLKEKDHGKAILMTTHMVHLVEELADEVVFLLEGKIYFRGNVKDLKGKYGGDSLEQAIANILTLERHV